MGTTMHRIRVNYTGYVVGPAVSTLFFSPGTPTDATAAACVTKVAAFLTAIKSGVVSPTAWTVQGAVDDIDSDTGDLVGFHNGSSATDGGSASGNPPPPSLQANLRLNTSIVFNRRRVLGHWYLPGPAGVNAAGSPTGALLTTVAANYATLIGGTAPMLVFHRPKGPHGTVQHGLAVQVQSITVAPKLAVLRSRRD
jgi:hypothetical protein